MTLSCPAVTVWSQMYVMDTPGVAPPALPSDEAALKLALVGALKSSVIGEEVQVGHM